MGPDFLGALALDRAQVITACDATFCSVFGCESVVGKTLAELMSPRDREGAAQLAAQLGRGERADVLLTLRLDGVDHLARVRVQPAADGFALHAEHVRGAEDLVYRLMIAAERWKGMIRSSADGILVLDEHGRIVEHNAAAVRLVGFRDAHGVALREDEIVGRPLADVIGPPSAELAAYLRDPAEDLRVRADDLEIKATPIVIPGRERIGTVVLVRDVREEAQIQARDAIIARDLSSARAFQQMLLAKPPPSATHDIEIAYRPVAQVGGDVYDVVVLPDHRVRLFIADATGHGVTAALVTMLVKSAYDAVKLAGRPSDVLARLNDRVADSARSLDAMFTAAVVDVDLEAKRIVHASAAHLPPLVVSPTGVTELECGGTFMGVSRGRVYPSWSHPLPEGAAIYLLTDGLAEARRPDGEQFGEDRVRRALAEVVNLPSGGGEAVLARLDTWLRPGVPDDDITILGLRPRYA